MTWGGNRVGYSRQDYEQWIMKMTGRPCVNSILRKLNKNELKKLKYMIETAQYNAVEEYKKGVLNEKN